MKLQARTWKKAHTQMKVERKVRGFSLWRKKTRGHEGLELKAADGGRVESLDSRMNVGSILSVVF